MINDNWTKLDEAFKNEAISRADINVDDLCIYGIKPLDDSLVCIPKNELVVIGADSGAGKSELSLKIAQVNAKRGKKVAMYYLEGGYTEALARMKWRDIAQEYFKNYSHLGIDMDYRKWSLNMLRDTALMEIESKVWEKYKNEYKNNLIFYSSKNGLDLDKLLSSLLDLHKLIPNEAGTGITTKLDLDLIIIDHLQYFSLMKAESEIFEITEILKSVKNITEHFNTPVILVSHLRKKARDRGLPGQEDFYGSSNIPKIASTAITLAPSSDKDNLSEGIYPTYIRVAKSRVGVKSNYAFLIDFYLDRREYSDTYDIVRLDNFGNVAENSLTEEQKPKYTRRENAERGTNTSD
jgi:replicative DNA helicase